MSAISLATVIPMPKRALQLSALESENEFHTSLLTEHEIVEQGLVTKEYTEQCCRSEEKIWRLSNLKELIEALTQHTARQRSLVQAYKALEAIQRHFQ